jgi:hypothetical protein
MSYEKTSKYPLVDCHSNDFSESKYSVLIFFELLCFVNSLEEESSERF